MSSVAPPGDSKLLVRTAPVAAGGVAAPWRADRTEGVAYHLSSPRLTHWGNGVRRAISIAVAALLAVSVVSTVVVWTEGSAKRPLQVVRGVVDSESMKFFGDPRVKAAFAERGLDVRITTTGNRQIATTVARSKYDFALGAGAPPVEALTPRRSSATSVPFFTPMVVATFTTVARVLERAGVAHDHGGWWTLDMKSFLDLAAQHVRWNELPGSTAYPSTNVVGITSTDITTSNSAEMYASIASYVLNENRVLDSSADVDEVVNSVSPLFLGQDKAHQSTAAVFRDYIAKGEDTTPMAMIPEAAFVARAGDHDGAIRPNMVLMYPDPDVQSPTTLVPLTRAGNAVGRLLTRDPSLQQLTTRHGFRTTLHPAAFGSFVHENHIAVQPHVRDVIEPPAGDILEALMTRINAALHVTLGPRPATSASLA